MIAASTALAMIGFAFFSESCRLSCLVNREDNTLYFNALLFVVELLYDGGPKSIIG